MTDLQALLTYPTRDIDTLLRIKDADLATQEEFVIANYQGAIRAQLEELGEAMPEHVAALERAITGKSADLNAAGPRVRVTRDREGAYGRVVTNEAPPRNGTGNGSGRSGRPASEKQLGFLRSLLRTHESHRLERFEAAVEAGKVTAAYASQEITRLLALGPPQRTASDKQQAFFTSLLGSREIGPALADLLAKVTDLEHLTMDEAAILIPALKSAPSKVRHSGPDVPAGHYAVPGEDGELRFYRVDRPTSGQWAGRTFLKVQASDEWHRVHASAVAGILRKIEANPAEAATTYGRELGHCYRCNRTLTDQTSRALGIGPECRSKVA